MNEFTKDDLVTISQALNEVLNGPGAIEEWEFHTRMGVTREEAKKVLNKISEMLKPEK